MNTLIAESLPSALKNMKSYWIKLIIAVEEHCINHFNISAMQTSLDHCFQESLAKSTN